MQALGLGLKGLGCGVQGLGFGILCVFAFAFKAGNFRASFTRDQTQREKCLAKLRSNAP